MNKKKPHNQLKIEKSEAPPSQETEKTQLIQTESTEKTQEKLVELRESEIVTQTDSAPADQSPEEIKMNNLANQSQEQPQASDVQAEKQLDFST